MDPCPSALLKMIVSRNPRGETKASTYENFLACDSFTKPQKEKVLAHDAFDLQELLDRDSFTEPQKEKVLVHDAFDLQELLDRDSFTKPQKGKVSRNPRGETKCR